MLVRSVTSRYLRRYLWTLACIVHHTPTVGLFAILGPPPWISTQALSRRITYLQSSCYLRNWVMRGQAKNVGTPGGLNRKRMGQLSSVVYHWQRCSSDCRVFRRGYVIPTCSLIKGLLTGFPLILQGLYTATSSRLVFGTRAATRGHVHGFGGLFRASWAFGVSWKN